MNVLLAVTIIVSFLTGCGSQVPQAKSYLLTSDSIKANADYQAEKPIIVLAPVGLDNLLGSKGIVYQTSPTEAVVARQHLWAGNISTQLANRLLIGLRQEQNRYWLVPGALQIKTPEVATLLVNLRQFNGSYQGYAVVAGEWSLLDGQGALLKSQPFSIKEPLAADGYTALVNALAKATDQLIAGLGRELSGLVMANNPAQ
ncbi:membrane integrity-associated transporter subunit PqiC [Endozoicomonas sp. SCSIO W0465]|uniref:PqiC family protein n=1 Tax=Endozoicomonas sp. SCSIO W0465 TaxID=2918516 RepID=UPI00207635E5|nr:ABC-type transport auxiliary lipoprotein family protein [Endozoicomonas sp. SCSIO W0465]USE36974.1 ABC-type transport auxiliary lipoprotein family protein [Endozoicomonas sp. SCSIO W0465]